ncbi:MAG TPA: uroporphyrinogen-III C-methyltransferase [Streptosporangiaceae bacterium]|jgi:uroporphyrin-III C-methyltransferase/precorrin-2 dehydrogenase/sirohydrochlorin ferrochelatase
MSGADAPDYPVTLGLAGRRVVVVGGGAVALRRTEALVAAGALVTVIAPRITPELATLAAPPRPRQPQPPPPPQPHTPVTLVRREYAAGDLDGAWLVHAATGDPAVNAVVAADAERDRVWCVRADDAAASAAWTPAVTRHGDVTVAVTSGGDPGRSRALRAAIAAGLADGSLPAHRRRAVRAALGRVALVGGGPGDPGLITVTGRRLLAEADVVVTDKLAPRALLDELAPGTEIIDAGKAPHAHNLTQDEINELIVSRALAGQRVVRLKGGDPFVFGRGGEEALACARAGVPVQVVPGVTSAIAVPAAAGIPVTHRGLTQDFAVVSAHLDPSQPGVTVDWESLARGPGTLVLMMGVAHLSEISAELIKRGRDAATPVAVICDGTLPGQRVLTSTLGEVADAAEAASITPPAVIVIGEVVRLRDALAQREALALGEAPARPEPPARRAA